MLALKPDNESYSHYCAKHVLVHWLRSSQGRFFSLRWTHSTRIYDEYPLLLDGSRPLSGPHDECWDEIPSKICTCPVIYEHGLLTSALNPCHHHLAREDNIPSREEVIIYGFKVGAIVDIAIVDGGRVKYIFEVVHTNPVSPMKRKLLLRYAEEHNCIIYEVTCDYILRQVGAPQRWEGRKLTVDSRPIRRFRRRWRGNKK